MVVAHIIGFAIGLVVVAGTLFSAIETFVLPRSAPDGLTRLVFRAIRFLFNLRLKKYRTYAERDRIMGFYAPFSLLSLVPVWYALICAGYTCMFWGIGTATWYQAFRLSGSSLFTLGFEIPETLAHTLLSFSEAMIGLILVALLIAYLPTMYAAFSRREAIVTLLEVRAGDPPSALEMILRYRRIHGLGRLTEVWQTWETWFAEIEESHTSLPAIVFFRSPQANHSWITAAGAVLDAAAITLSGIQIPFTPEAALCIRAGYLALRHISDFFGISYSADPHFPDTPVSISRAEFEQVLDQLAANDVPVNEDRDQAWLDFAGWRVNYDQTLLALAGLTMAPEAPWSSDRSRIPALSKLFGKAKPGA